MNEDKQAICDALCEALKLTCNYGGGYIRQLKYCKDEHKEIVSVIFIDYSFKDINVACDSGTALIRDVMNNLH